MAKEPEKALPEEEVPYDAGDPKAVKKRTKQQADTADEEARVLAHWLSTEAGRRLYARLVFGMCGLNQPSARRDAQGRHDVHATEFQEGCRAVGYLLQQEALQKAKPQYMLLVQENLK